MGLHHSDLPAGVMAALQQGGVIPAHPLALNLHWRPPFEFEAGLRLTAEWYRARGG
jgi:hypothetical protein